MRPLCLDIGDQTGWAFYDVNREDFGLVYFDPEVNPAVKDSSRPAKLDFFSKWLTWALETKFKPTHVYIEEPFAGGRDVHVEHWLHGLFAVAELVCWRKGITFRPVANHAIKRHATGNGRAKKPVVMARVNAARPGRNITNHNVADAVALLDMVREQNRLGADSFVLRC